MTITFDPIWLLVIPGVAIWTFIGLYIAVQIIKGWTR